MVWRKGKQLNNGKFVIVGEEPLGSGGFGITYKVARTRDRKLFVIKTLNAIARSKSNFRQIKDDFLNEAHTLAGFKHDNIVKIYPKGFTEEIEEKNELWCMVMEFIEGQNLEEYLEENKEISEIDAIALITKVGEALTYIHQSNYVHRDIKPSNIMLRNRNLSSPILIDFGLAREFDPEKSLTMDSKLTEHFAPLEQYDLNSFVKHLNLDRAQYRVGAWTDVYALAATLYNLLTNKMPLSAPYRKAAPDYFELPNQLNPKISDRTNAAILKGMAIEPSDRPQTVQEWLDLLSDKVLKNGFYCLKEPLNQNHMCKNAYDFSDEYNVVYKAIETNSQTPVIIKTLSKEAITSSLNSNLTLEKTIAYLRNEANLTKEINRYKINNIVSFRDYFEEYEIPYLVLDFIEGENLFKLVERLGKLSEEKAVKYIKHIASALLVCHKHKIYHRDVNPDNIIILSKDNRAILIDFDVSSNSELTGNNFFKPPQQINRENFNIDLYSLAATLYYLVTGVNPSGGLHDLIVNRWFNYDSEKQKQVLKPPKHFNRDLSDYLDRAIVEGMKFEKSDRQLSIQQWLNLLNKKDTFKNNIKINPIVIPEQNRIKSKFGLTKKIHKNELNFFLVWTTSISLGTTLLGYFLFVLENELYFFSDYTAFGIALWIITNFAVIGWIQRFILQYQIRKTDAWINNTLLGAFFSLLFFLVLLVYSVYTITKYLFLLACVGGLVGLFQERILRKTVNQALVWIAINMIAFPVSLLPMWYLEIYTIGEEINFIIAQFIMGLIFGVISGLGIVVILRNKIH